MPAAYRLVVRSTFAFLLVGFLALLGIVGMTFWLGERAQIYFGEAIAARDMRGAAVELRSAVQTAESSQRGFLFTGNEIYLAPYETAKTQAQRQLEALRRSLDGSDGSATLIERLGAIIVEKFDEMDETIALKRARRDAEALAITRTNRGKTLMDEANVFFSGIIRTADDRLTRGVEEQSANAHWLRVFSLVGGLVILAVVAGAASILSRYTRELRQARDEVTALNADLETRVQNRTADLAQVNEEIQRFAYIVTHDLRAPLVNIAGFTAEIESAMASLRALVDAAAPDDPLAGPARAALAEDLPEALGFIRSSIHRMDGLIGAILKLSREGRRTLRPESIDLAKLIEASIGAIRHQLSEAEGVVHVEADIPPMVSDRLALEQVVGNLLDNAVKYRATERPLWIDVRARTAGPDRITLEIADNGRGIAEQDRERVFELFSRSGPQDRPGEGMGLAYVRSIVRNLGGEVRLTSVLGEGTTFRITLPRSLQAPSPRSAEPQPAPAAAT